MQPLTVEELQTSGDLIASKSMNVSAVLSNERAFQVFPYSPFVLTFEPEQLRSIQDTMDIPHNYGDSINEFWLIVKKYVYHIVPDMDVWFSQNPRGFIVLFDDYQLVGYDYVARDVRNYATPEYEMDIDYNNVSDEYEIAVLDYGEEYEQELPDEFEKFNTFVQGLVLEYGWPAVRSALSDFGTDFAFKDKKHRNVYEENALKKMVKKYSGGIDVDDSDFLNF